jgi:hypothetical protein
VVKGERESVHSLDRRPTKHACVSACRMRFASRLFAVFLDSEDGDSVFVRNISELVPDYTASYLRRRNLVSTRSRLGCGAIPPRNRDSIPGRYNRFFLPQQHPSLALGPTQHPIQWVPGSVSKGVKRPGRLA